MAWSASGTKGPYAMGNMRCSIGTFSQGNGDTGGTITKANHGMHTILYVECTAATNISVSGTTATITTADPTADQAGYWKILGY